MVRTVPIRAESGRYTTPLLILPDLWAGTESWDAVASFLGHRGWEGAIVDLRSIPGDLATRATAVAEYVARQASPPALVGHGTGALVASAAAVRGTVAALTLIAPPQLGSDPVRRLAWRREAIVDLLLGRPARPPTADVATSLFGGLPARVSVALGPDDRAVFLDVLRGRGEPIGATGTPTLVVAGARDPLSPPAHAAALAARLGADCEVVPDAGHWLIADDRWLATGNVLHRWLVRRLGEALLDFYAEAMAERDADGDD